MIKTFLKGIQIVCIPKICLSMTSQIDLLRSSLEENDQLYFVALVEKK